MRWTSNSGFLSAAGQKQNSTNYFNQAFYLVAHRGANLNPAMGALQGEALICHQPRYPDLRVFQKSNIVIIEALQDFGREQKGRGPRVRALLPLTPEHLYYTS